MLKTNTITRESKSLSLLIPNKPYEYFLCWTVSKISLLFLPNFISSNASCAVYKHSFKILTSHIWFSENSCLTIDGAPLLGRVGQVGVQCKFPFSFAYLGMTFGPYDACANYFGTLYCATDVDNNGNALNFGVCDPNCALPGKLNTYSVQKYFRLGIHFTYSQS